MRRVRPEISRHELRTGQWNKTPSNSERDTLNELRSTIIEDYRRSTASVEATTASTRRSSTAYTSTVSDHQQVKQYTQTLNSMHNEAVKIVQKYQKFVQELSEQTISATFSQDVQQNLKVQLQTRLNDLVQNLQIDNQVKNQVSKIIPQAVELEINSQLKPLAEQITERMSSVEQFQQKLAQLIQQVSSKL